MESISRDSVACNLNIAHLAHLVDTAGKTLRDQAGRMKAAPLSDSTAEKLSRVIPRLASNYDGEVIATAGAIDRVLKSDGADFHDLSGTIRLGAWGLSIVGPDEPEWSPASWRFWILSHRWDDRRTARECQFLESMLTWIERRRPLSQKQRWWLEDLVDKIATSGARGNDDLT
jgi:hypothetical protein